MTHVHVMQLELRWYQQSAVVEATKLSDTQAGPDSDAAPDLDSEPEFELEPHFELMLDD